MCVGEGGSGPAQAAGWTPEPQAKRAPPRVAHLQASLVLVPLQPCSPARG